MKKSMALLASGPQHYSVRRLLEECEKQDIRCHFYCPEEGQLSSSTLLNDVHGVINRVTGVSYDDWDLWALAKWENQGKRIVNSTHSTLIFRGKYSQYSQMVGKVPVIPTYTGRGPIPFTPESHEGPFDPYLWVVKPDRSHQGRGLFLTVAQELADIMKSQWELGDQRYVYQPLLLKRKEWRVLIVGGKVLGALQKHFNDPSEMATASKVAVSFSKILSPEINELALKAYAVSGLEMAGLDIALTDTGPYIVEINCCPGFEVFERESKINVAKEMIDSLFILKKT